MELPRIVVKPPGPKTRAIVDQDLDNISPGYSGTYRNVKIAFERGQGAMLQDYDGNQYLDFACGAVVMNLGHAHPRVVHAVQDQIAKLDNIYPYGSQSRSQLRHDLAKLLPAHLNKIAFQTTGAEAVDCSIKLAKAYTKKFEVISFLGSFHGKSQGPLSVTNIRGGKFMFGPLLPGMIVAPFAYCYRCPIGHTYPECDLACYHYLEHLVAHTSSNRIAALVTETVQGTSGRVYPPEEWLKAIQEFCRDRDIVFIIDEVLTGLGRTGKMWAHQHYNLKPDIIAIGKPLGSGLPISAIAAREDLTQAERWVQDFAYSITHGGNPVSCAAALATVQTFLTEKPHENAARLAVPFSHRLNQFKADHRIVGDVRTKGLFAGIEFVKDKQTKDPATIETKAVARRLLEKGIVSIQVGTYDNVISVTPPLIINEALLLHGLDLFDEAITEIEQEYPV